MAIFAPNTGVRTPGSASGSQFASVRFEGLNQFAAKLRQVADGMLIDSAPFFKAAAEKAAGVIAESYKGKLTDATGNLRKSVKVISKAYPSGVVVGVTGPRQTGSRKASPEAGSGNHAWLLEYGSGRRFPGTQNRQTYVDVFKSINGKMKRSQNMSGREFRRAGPGYYFLMGSLYERQGMGGKPGYSRDFSDSYGTREQHPITLRPGESIDPMPAEHFMQHSINDSRAKVEQVLFAEIAKRWKTLTN